MSLEQMFLTWMFDTKIAIEVDSSIWKIGVVIEVCTFDVAGVVVVVVDFGDGDGDVVDSSIEGCCYCCGKLGGRVVVGDDRVLTFVLLLVSWW